MVYVLSKEGKPLMPTERYGKVRRMLRDGLAKVETVKPFTIRLLYEPETQVVQQVVLGVDPGRTNIGLSAVRSDGRELYSATCHTRNKEIPKLMLARRCFRQQSRRGERLARKRLAKRLGTTSRKVLDRMLPGCEKPVKVKDIINTEARFNNRMRSEKWLTPTARQLLQTHVRLAENVCRILPVSDIVLEVNKFAFMAMENPSVKRLDYQNGPLKGFGSVENAVYAMQDGRCLLCGDEITRYHHIVARKRGGSNVLANLAGLCECCHTAVHTDRKTEAHLAAKKTGLNKKYGALSVLNQIIPHLTEAYAGLFPEHAFLTTGLNTKLFREAHGIDKAHNADAYCIASEVLQDSNIVLQEKPYEILQFRRHNRAIVKRQSERTYFLDGVKVATNRRKRMDQKYDSLADWYDEMCGKHGIEAAEAMRSRLTVRKSKRSYNNLSRVLPGAVFAFERKRYVMTGQHCGGRYYYAYGEGKKEFPAKQCRILRRSGLVYA